MGKEDLPSSVWIEPTSRLQSFLTGRRNIWREQLTDLDVSNQTTQWFAELSGPLTLLTEREMKKSGSGWECLESDIDQFVGSNPFASKLSDLSRVVLKSGWDHSVDGVVDSIGELTRKLYLEDGITIIAAVPSVVQKVNGIEWYLMKCNEETKRFDSVLPNALAWWKQNGFDFGEQVLCMTGTIEAGAGFGVLRRTPGQWLTKDGLVYLDVHKIQLEEQASDTVVGLNIRHEGAHTVFGHVEYKHEELIADLLAVADTARHDSLDGILAVYEKSFQESQAPDAWSQQYALAAETICDLWKRTSGKAPLLLEACLEKAHEILK